jgi:CDP-diacylglycerol--glycerol-3-phosphate 3-phosphatidyltransferase
MFDGRWRSAVDRNTGPVGKQLVRWGVTADLLTASGLVFAVATAVVVGTGHLLIGVPLLALTGFHDLLDGPVAKAGGTASVRGAFFDSVTDRVADAVLMGGVAWYLIGRHEGHLVLLPLAVLGVTALVSYERAKAESLGLSAKGGLMERAERMVLLGVSLLATQIFVPVLWLLLLLTIMTALGRFWRVWQIAARPEPPVRWRPRRNFQHTGRLRRGPRRTARH